MPPDRRSDPEPAQRDERDGPPARGPSLAGLRLPDSRERIVDVAEGLFAYGGYAGVGMRQLAATVGLGKSSLFHHFPTKLELYAAVLDRVLERIEAGLARVDSEATVSAAAPALRLEEWIAAVVRTLAEDPPAGRLMMRALVDEEPFPGIQLALAAQTDRELMSFEVRLAGIVGRFQTLLEEGIAQGVFRPVSVGDAISSVIGTLVFHFASGDLGEALIGESIFTAAAVERRRQEVSEFILRGLLA